MIRKSIIALVAVGVLSGCNMAGNVKKVHDFTKDVESKAYDSLAAAFTEYCAKQSGDIQFLDSIVEQEALELRREIRQRGGEGPAGPQSDVPQLDVKTAFGKGPVVRVYCSDDEVPHEVWNDFIRVKD